MENYQTRLFNQYPSSSTPPAQGSYLSFLNMQRLVNSQAAPHNAEYSSKLMSGMEIPIVTTSHMIMSSSGRPEENTDHEAAGSTKKKIIKKPRYAFQTRSQVDILDDGYKWRKYGQKAVKNNKFPRSYYRCTYQGCNVKKQVQRLSKDEGIVVTTYEGRHSHPIERSTENFEDILSQMQIYSSVQFAA